MANLQEEQNQEEEMKQLKEGSMIFQNSIYPTDPLIYQIIKSQTSNNSFKISPTHALGE